jgi:hypothetical protein
VGLTRERRRAFIRAAHDLNVSLFLNDHPMQPDPSYAELSPKELRFRWDGLTSLMDLGLDFWWFDCHWHDLIPGIQCPGKGRGKGAANCSDGVDYAAWGQYVFTAVMAKYHEASRKRTMMLGCSNSAHRANHRTPVWWTGDNLYDTLALGVSYGWYCHLDASHYIWLVFLQCTKYNEGRLNDSTAHGSQVCSRPWTAAWT